MLCEFQTQIEEERCPGCWDDLGLWPHCWPGGCLVLSAARSLQCLHTMNGDGGGGTRGTPKHVHQTCTKKGKILEK